MNYTIESMNETHRQGVMDVYNYYIEHSWAAFPDRPMPVQFFDRLLESIKGYPSAVVKNESGKIIGFAFLHAYHFANTMKRTGDIAYFLMPEASRQGLGTKILESFIEPARAMGIDNIMACISSRNEESLRFHIKNGFIECGRFPRVGRKFGQDFDIIWMQRRI